MFEFVRKHTKLLQFVLVLLIFPSFVFFGIQGYSRFSEGGASTVAKVDGRNISQAEWDQAHQRQVDRMRQQMPNIDVKLFDNPAARRETLETLVRERVLLSAAVRQNLMVTDERLQRLFLEDPQFAALRNADGSVNQALLAAQGMTSQSFVAQLRQELGMQQVLRGVAGTSLEPNAVADRALDALLQRREIAMARFDAKTYAAKIQPSDEQIDSYYKTHQAEFSAPEQANIEYVVLDLETLKKAIAVPEDELRAYYNNNASRYTVAEERRARHILIQTDKDAGADVKQKAKARADALLAEVRKAPGSFADLAKKNSADAGSAAQGGDLEFAGRGGMVSKALEDAVFAMKVGEVGEVETEFGYHVVRLEAVRGGDKKPLEAVRSEIEEEIRKQMATKRWAEAAEQFTNTVYEQADSLQPVIDKLKLEKHTASVKRQPAPGATGALASAKLLDAVFANDAVRNKRNTDAVEVAPEPAGVGAGAAAPAGAHRAAGRGARPRARTRDRNRGGGGSAQGRRGAVGSIAAIRSGRFAGEAHRVAHRGAGLACAGARCRAAARQRQAAVLQRRRSRQPGLRRGAPGRGAAARDQARRQHAPALAGGSGLVDRRDAGVPRCAEVALQGRDPRRGSLRAGAVAGAPKGRAAIIKRVGGGCSSVGRVPDCDSGRRGFESHQPPHFGDPMPDRQRS